MASSTINRFRLGCQVVVVAVSLFGFWGADLFAGYWDTAPEDPSVLRDTRDIPEIENYQKKSASKIKPATEREVIIERVKPDSELTKEQKLVLNLPNLSQILLVVGIVILFIIYRSRQARANRARRR